MRGRVQKWGNSLAIRIPKPLAEEAELGPDAEVELTVDEEGGLSLRRVRQPEYTLEELLEGVRPENLHGETDTGRRVGREAW